MIRGKEEIRKEIDQTLDRLLENDRALQNVRSSNEFAEEVHALEKLQESLMAHLMHLDNLLSNTPDTKKPLLTKNISKRLSRGEHVKRAPKVPKAPRRRAPRSLARVNRAR